MLLPFVFSFVEVAHRCFDDAVSQTWQALNVLYKRKLDDEP